MTSHTTAQTLNSWKRWGAIASPMILGALLFGCPTAPPGGGGRDSGTPGGDSGTVEDGSVPDSSTRVDGGGGSECGGIAGFPCPDGEYCYIVEGCGFDDGAGTCQPIPDACPEVFSPVCGCDGITYDNDCFAAAAGQSVLHIGACESPPICLPMDAAGVGDCRAILGYAWDGRACGPITGCECAGADCASLYESMEACDAAHIECGGTGGPCDPMDAAGEGPCDLELGWVWDGGACVSISGCSCVGVDCRGIFRDQASCDAAYVDCGGTTTSCGLPGTPGCAAADYCEFTMCGRDGRPGSCEPVPTACPDIFAPVCGCDGTTYGNDCEAAAARVSVDYAGMCRVAGATCGVRGSAPCARREYCDFPDMACGAADVGGTCQPRPEICPDVIAPVCGCDGVTYNNECEANAAGQDIVSTGACPRPGA